MNEIRISLSEFTELVNQRKTNKEIAEHYGISAQKVSQLKKEAGLRTPKAKKVILVDDTILSDNTFALDPILANETSTGDRRIGDYTAKMDNYDDSINTTARMNDVEFN